MTRSPIDFAAIVGKPALIIGSGGKLARAFGELLESRGWTVRIPSLDELDLTRDGDVHRWVTEEVGLVINTAAYTDVDGCETHRELALAVNAEGPGRLARRCTETSSALIHFSTDYVFPGTRRRPYQPHDRPEPINVYGQTKVLGERLVLDAGCRCLLVRTSALYAPWGPNFVRTMVERCLKGRDLRVVNDRTIRPTDARHLARTSLALFQRGCIGIWHVTDGGSCTWYEWAEAIAAQVGTGCQVEACSSAEFQQPARRPTYSVLDLAATEALLGPMPHWRNGLPAVVEAIRADAGGGRWSVGTGH